MPFGLRGSSFPGTSRPDHRPTRPRPTGPLLARPRRNPPLARKKFTPLQRAFVAEFVRDKNGTKAAIRAGCEPANARSMAYEWRNLPEFRHVQDAIDLALSDCLIDAKATRRRCYLELTRIAFGVIPIQKLRDVLNDPTKKVEDVLEEEELALLAGFTMSKFQDSGITISPKQWHKIQAINLLLKHFGTEDGMEAEDQKASQALQVKLEAMARRLESDAEAELAILTEDNPEPNAA